jgi:hypothetical protein
MTPDDAVRQALESGSADLGTYPAPELAAVGFPVVTPDPVSALAISSARSSLAARGLATADSHGAIRVAAGDLGTWQQLNAHTRGVLVCLGDHRLQVQVLADAPQRPVLALTYETLGEEHRLGLGTLPDVVRRVGALVLPDGDGPTSSQLVFARPRPGGRDVVEVRIEQGPPVRVQERHTVVDRALPPLAPETDATRLAAWLTALLGTTW